MTPDRDADPGLEEVAASLRDPVRRRVLFVLDDRPQGATIRQLALRLKEPPRRIRHYIEILVDAGQVVVEGERSRRNTIERSYRSAGGPLLQREDWHTAVGLTDTKMVLLDILRLTFDNVTEAVAAGTFAGRQGWCVARTWREVDAQGWEAARNTGWVGWGYGAPRGPWITDRAGRDRYLSRARHPRNPHLVRPSPGV
jgi:DNA-binding transcriptional ArsR family regulator